MTDLAVLIAGTSGSYLEISKKMLRFHFENCEVDFAYSGRECIDKASTKSYELILFDYELGDMTGLEVLETLKQVGTETPLIILIDEGDEVKAIRAIEQGAADYILKVRGYLTALPFTIRNILEKSARSQRVLPGSSSKLPAVTQVQNTGVGEGYFILDRKGRILSASRDIEALTDFTEEELVELSFCDLIPRERERSFFDWLGHLSENGQTPQPFETEVVSKQGHRVALEVLFTPIRDENHQIQSYRGKINLPATEVASDRLVTYNVDQMEMVASISQIITTSYDEPLNVFLEKIAELTSRIFRFQRTTIALLDRKKRVFIKQAMVGYHGLPAPDQRSVEVPQEVIHRAFTNRFRVKVMYYNQDHRNLSNSLNSKFPERRTQRRRPPSQWHQRDLVLVNLRNRQEKTFGYISLDRPEPKFIPKRDTFHNLELFGQLVAFAVENYHQFSSLERHSRRLKQMLITSNIFKLHLSLTELLHEVVWSIHFSTDFNLVALGLIGKRTGCLEIKAVACEDKIKAQHLRTVQIPVDQLASLLRAEYASGKSYLVTQEEDVARPLKNIYYGSRTNGQTNDHWPAWGLLLVPIKSRQGKIIGMLLTDDPANNRLPSADVVHTLEIMANQIAVAIDNRVLYVKAKHQKANADNDRFKTVRKELISELRSSSSKQRFVDRFFK